MSLQKFMENAVSEWMRGSGPESDIVISSRIRIARNIRDLPFPLLADQTNAGEVINQIKQIVDESHLDATLKLEYISIKELSELEKQVLVEKHLISPHLAEDSRHGAVLLSDNESVSVMINEEDHLRIQCMFSGFQLDKAWELGNEIDDAFEKKLHYAFDEDFGFLTSCPTNVGTGIRASVMMHLPALVMTQQINRILSAITQVGLAVRGIYGEGSEAQGNLFQVSNQITLGLSEQEIMENLRSVATQIIDHERSARSRLMQESRQKMEDRVHRSYGILSHARILDSKEAAQRLSDLRLGIDIGMLTDVSPSILNELMVLTQPAFLQQYYGQKLTASERDNRRASLIRERLQMKNEE